jgi:transposase
MFASVRPSIVSRDIVLRDTNCIPVPEVQSERLDDIPLLLHILVEMGVPEYLDSAYSPHKNWQGLSVGWVATVWLAYILSQCDHRMNHVRDWVNARRDALEKWIGQEIRETDFTDDRLGEVLRYLSVNSTWQKVESSISQHTIIVYDLQPGAIRLDATVGQVYHDPEQHTLFQVGRTKAGDYDTQFKLMLGALDPMGLPLAVDVVSGERADDTLYVPIYQRIRQTLGQRGLLYVGDAKMGAIETRATIAAGGDWYLVSLAMVGETPTLLDSLLDHLDASLPAPLDDSLRQAGWGETTKVYRPEDQPSDLEQDPDPECAIAEGFETSIQRSAVLSGQPIIWTERVFCVKSFTYALAQRTGLNNRLEQAEAALRALTPPPGRGRKQYTDEATLMAAIDQILKRLRVEELLDVTWERQETRRPIRAYGERPARTETTVRYQVYVTPNTDAIAKAERRLGFRLYATNAPSAALSLSGAVLTYREQYIAERDFARLNGRHLGITPLYVQRDDHACGLVRLLTLALRVMVMMEFLARRTLAEQNTTLSGIYAGNPARSTAHPTAEQMLTAFKEITLTTIRLPNNLCIQHLTPLTHVQELILVLLGTSAAIYTDQVTSSITVFEGVACPQTVKWGLNPSTIAQRESSCAVRISSEKR